MLRVRLSWVGRGAGATMVWWYDHDENSKNIPFLATGKKSNHVQTHMAGDAGNLSRTHAKNEFA
jgi:hypothetical protein